MRNRKVKVVAAGRDERRQFTEELRLIPKVLDAQIAHAPVDVSIILFISVETDTFVDCLKISWKLLRISKLEEIIAFGTPCVRICMGQKKLPKLLGKPIIKNMISRITSTQKFVLHFEMSANGPIEIEC